MTVHFNNIETRKKIILVIILGFFGVIVFQLYKMQILENNVYESKSEENSIKKNIVNPPRGIFFDRNFNILVSNKPSFSLEITPDDYDTTYNSVIEKMSGISQGRINSVFADYKGYSRFIPRKIVKDINFDFIAWYEENNEKLDGVDYKVEMKRDYSYGINGSHLFGYIKEIPRSLYSVNKSVYDLGDLVGYTGVEKNYEPLLRGRKGYALTLVDSRQKVIGRYLEGTLDKKPVKGADLVLTIDRATQQAAEFAMRDYKGAVVAIEPTTGEILAFVSAPGFNLDFFGSVTSSDIWKQLMEDPDKPMFNRATMSIYPPGSTIKMLESIIALEENIWDSEHSVRCGGAFQFGIRPFKCTHVHGKVDMIRSIEKSCNVYYYQLALKIGLKRWGEYLRKFGFGYKTGVDIPEEIAGFIPDSSYYNRVYKNDWTDGILLSLGIGQGELSTTPIQLAQYAALLANYGKSVKPHFVKGIIDPETNEYIEPEYEEINTGLKRESFEIVREGMYKVVHADGTGRWIRQPDFTIAGKTGTAQNPHGEDHAIFIAFAPYENPKIAIAVFVENVGYGSTYAAPVARDVIKAYMKTGGKKFDDLKNNNVDLASEVRVNDEN
ncbi:MAG: penicillin-binding protein 2 [Melioribacteraceae bacterium]|nr:MAG: penicillin-binding protein 2 [Melioribacteraceae bacterium]